MREQIARDMLLSITNTCDTAGVQLVCVRVFFFFFWFVLLSLVEHINIM